MDNTAEVVTEVFNEGTDLVKVNIATPVGTYSLSDNVENATLINSIAYSLTGNALDNILTGNAATNTLRGGAGNDTLDGRAGADTLIGGTGDDTYFVDNALDVVTEVSAEGTDTVNSTVSYLLSADVEKLTLIGAVAINGTGNVLNNVLTGNTAANVLNGGTGTDTLIGGDGNDTYVVNSADDIVTESNALAVGGIDLIQSSVAWTLGNNLENLTLTGSDAIDGTGNTLANLITGNSGNNVLDGGAGIDSLIGGVGNDTYIVDLITTGNGSAAIAALQDTITETGTTINGIDTLQLRGNSSNSVATTLALAANLENLDASATGTTKLNLTGNASDNILIGNSAANTLSGGAGNDIIFGGNGDTLNGNEGNDFAVYSGGGIVSSFNGGIGDDTLVFIRTAGKNNFTFNGGDGFDELRLSVGSGLEPHTFWKGNLGSEASQIEAIALGTGTGATANTSDTTANGLDTSSYTENGLILTGNSGANSITGTHLSDKITGGTGNDTFIFSTALDSVTNIDTITDFTSGQDAIQLNLAIFTTLGATGVLNADTFYNGTNAHDASDRIIYDNLTGTLYYDEDGTGSAVQVEFIKLTGIPAIINTDFIVGA